MRIGIVPTLNSFSGGIYQYSLTMLQCLYESRSAGCEDDFVVFAYEAGYPAVLPLNGPGWAVKPLSPPSLRSQIGNALRQFLGEQCTQQVRIWLQYLKAKGVFSDANLVRLRHERSRWFHRCGLEMMLYPTSNSLSFETSVPYVMAVHDLQHRLQPEFPEVSANGEWESREYVYRNGTRYATLLVADSEVGKEDILDFYGSYGVTPDRVKVLPFLPACYLTFDVSESERRRVRTTYRLPERYLFYPAQFWPHKNHGRVIQALGLLKQERHMRIPLVLCGSYTGKIRERTFQEVISLARQLGVEEQIQYLGYVPDGDMSGLYAEAVALIMPTFFGPTNIPILEAWAFGCPVLTSDIRGVRQQAGGAAILVDPRSADAIADGTYQLWSNENLRRALADRGGRRLLSYTPNDYRQRLVEILDEAKARVRSEKPMRVKQ